MDLPKHLLELILKRLVLPALVELADEMSAGFQGVARKGEGGFA